MYNVQCLAQQCRINHKRDICLLTTLGAGDDIDTVATQSLEQFADVVDTLFAKELPCDGSILTNARQFDAIRRAYDSMCAALQGLKLGMTPDMVLIDVEEAMEAMGEVTGATVREDITARIFERFCVGK